MATYEVHLGSWRRGRSYTQLAEELVPYQLLYEMARAVSNLSDAGELAERVLFGSHGEQVRKDVLEPVLDFGEHYEIRWQLQAVLARTLSKVPPPPPQADKVSINELDGLLEQLKDRRDLAKVEAAVKHLVQMAQRMRPKDGGVSEGIRNILDKGVVSACMNLMRTDDIKVYTYASWVLIELGSEHTDVRRQIQQEGLATVVKCANNLQDQKRYMASKLLSVCLREGSTVDILGKYKMDVKLPMPLH